jgi:tRNA wybutosine-synthesizing protein 1
MTTSLSCPNRCVFCWRGYKAPVSKEWEWNVDNPKRIIEGSLEAQQELLSGWKGNEEVDLKALEESKEVKHVALSLTGESLMYPKINELIDELHRRGISTFLVTNGQYPEEIQVLRPITQLYLSMDAPNKELMKKVDVPLFDDYWERFNKSLEYLSEKKGRTCVRITLIKGVNDIDPEGYAKLIAKGDPDFVEVKAYMFVGESRMRLEKENMPLHEDVVKFTKELVKYLPGYEIADEHIPSRVVLLAKGKYRKDGKWNTWIDFSKNGSG